MPVGEVLDKLPAGKIVDSNSQQENIVDKLPEGKYTVGEAPVTKEGFSPYEGVELTSPPPNPTTFWQEVYDSQVPDESTITRRIIHPIVEGVKQGVKGVYDANKEVYGTLASGDPDFSKILHGTLLGITSAGKIAFNVIPAAVAFSTATNAIKMAADQTPYGKEVGEALDIPFTLATKVAGLMGYSPERDSSGALALEILDIAAGGKLAHETMSTSKGGKLKDVNGDVVKDKQGNAVPTTVPTIAGKVINSFKDLTGITEKAAKGELNPDQMKEFANYLEGLKKVTPNDIIKNAEDKIPTITNADQAYAKVNPEEQTDRQKSDMLHDVIKSGNVDTFKARLQELKDNGSLTPQQADEGFIRINSYEKNIAKINKHELPVDKSKEAAHLAWNVENKASEIKTIESNPEHKQDGVDEAILINHREQYKELTHALADVLANKPVEVAKETVKQAKEGVIFEGEQEFINKNWKDIRDDLGSKLKRDPTAEEVFAETRKLYKEKNPVKEPSEVEKTDKLFEEQLTGLTEKQNREFEEFQQKESEPKVEKPKVEVKVEPKTEEVKVEKPELNKNFEDVNVIPYDTVEKNTYKPNEQLKFNQGEYYEPVRIVARPDLIELIQIGSRESKMLTGTNKVKYTIDKVRKAQLEKELGISAYDAYKKAKELAKENRSKTIENIIEFSKKKGQPKAEVAKESKAEPKSEEKTFKSKHEELIAKKNKTKTKENPQGDVVTEEATFHLGDDFGYVEFADGTKANVATNPKAGTTIGFGNGKKLPKDGSKVTVEAKAADAERPFDRVNIHGFDKSGTKTRGMLRATNKSSNILEKTGEKNNPGAYADQAISGLTEADRQAIIEKEAVGAGLKKEEEKPVIDLDKKEEKQKRTDNPLSDAKIDPDFVPLEKRSKEAQSFIERMFKEAKKNVRVMLSIGAKVSQSEVKGILKDKSEGKNTYRLNRLMDELESRVVNDSIRITEGSGIAVGGRGVTIEQFLKESFGEENKTKQEGNADPLQDTTRGLTEKEQQDILEKEAKSAEDNKPQEQKKSSEPQPILIDKVVERLQKALPKLKVVYDKTIEGAGQLDANGKTVRVNLFKAGTDTPIHEYGHALIDIYGGLKNKLVSGAIERLKDTELWKEVESRYPELSKDMLAKEVLAEAIGREGKKIFEKEAQQTWFKNFVDNFFYKIKKLLGIEKDSAKMLAKQLLNGKEISDKTVATNETQLQKFSEEDMFKQFAEVYQKKSKLEKFKDRVTDALNVPRALITSMDMSAPMRQAVVYTLTKPKVAAASAKEMFRQAFSEKNSVNWLLDLRNKREYSIIEDSGLFISDPHASKLTNKEEHFMTNLAQKIPVIGSLVKGSERAYAAYLNKMRTDIFVNQIHMFEKKGLAFEKNPELYKSAANVINHFTGRGHLGKLEKSAQTLNTAFFSPRLIASRFQMLNPAWYAKQPKLVRMQAIKDFATFVGVGSSILALAAASGAKVSTDPRSSDFGKIQIGKTRLDIWGGFQQWVRTFSQIVSGEKITASGKHVDLTKGRATRLDVLGSFARGKIAPIPALAMELLQGRKVTGEKLTPKGVVLDNTIPLYIQDMMDAAKQEGGASILSVGIPAFFGVGTQTYDTNKK